MKTHIESLKEYLNENGFKAAIWKDRRVYLNGFAGRKYDRDINAYIDIDEPLEEVPEISDDEPFHPLLAGCALKVFSNAIQERQWLINRSKQFKKHVADQLYSVGLYRQATPEDWRQMK